MLNALKLSELLAKNADPKLYPRLFVMSPNGTLMAYSTPVDIKELRDQAALISMAWKDHLNNAQQPNANTSSNPHHPQSPQDPSSSPKESSKNLETLTIETQTSNIIIRAIQPSLLLILVGSVPPSRLRKPFFKITKEGPGDARYPSEDDAIPIPSSAAQIQSSPAPTSSPGVGGESVGLGKKRSPSILSTLSTRERDVKIGVLHIQRKKIDALTRFLREDFDAKGFVMPDDSSFP